VELKEKVKARILAKSPPPAIPPVGAGASISKEEFVSPTKFSVGTFTQLPVEDHGTDNDLARSVILSRVSAPKLDPNSDEAELARLLKHQMPVKKKGGEA
jgi:hypothetical protein